MYVCKFLINHIQESSLAQVIKSSQILCKITKILYDRRVRIRLGYNAHYSVDTNLLKK